MRVKHNDDSMARAADRPERLEHMRTRRILFTAMVRDRLAAEDWHGVRDAAAELGEIDAVLRELQR